MKDLEYDIEFKKQVVEQYTCGPIFVKFHTKTT